MLHENGLLLLHHKHLLLHLLLHHSLLLLHHSLLRGSHTLVLQLVLQHRCHSLCHFFLLLGPLHGVIVARSVSC